MKTYRSSVALVHYRKSWCSRSRVVHRPGPRRSGRAIFSYAFLDGTARIRQRFIQGVGCSRGGRRFGHLPFATRRRKRCTSNFGDRLFSTGRMVTEFEEAVSLRKAEFLVCGSFSRNLATTSSRSRRSAACKREYTAAHVLQQFSEISPIRQW